MFAPPGNSANLLNGSKFRTGVFLGRSRGREKGKTIEEDEALGGGPEGWGLDPEGQKEAPEGRAASRALWDLTSLGFKAAHKASPCPQAGWSLSEVAMIDD